MAYVCVDKNGQEKVFNDMPSRDGFGINDTFWAIFDYYSESDYGVDLPEGTIFRLIGRELTWEDEPVKL